MFILFYLQGSSESPFTFALMEVVRGLHQSSYRL